MDPDAGGGGGGYVDFACPSKLEGFLNGLVDRINALSPSAGANIDIVPSPDGYVINATLPNTETLELDYCDDDGDVQTATFLIESTTADEE